ncbi:hypothetical protein C8J57DRAFT_1524705 [Mycena rebaudengoi]|nr:hypothetical protein C8J57DRAFT_1524705 [Mycena rebaudengoi]
MSVFIQVDTVTLEYKGSSPLTISPPIGGTLKALNKGDIISIPTNDEAYAFKADGNTIASIYNHDDVNKVEITGGNTVPATSPFIVTVKLK